MPIALASAELPFSPEQWARLDAAFGAQELVKVSSKDRSEFDRALGRAEVALLSDTVELTGIDTPHLRWVHCNHAGLEAMSSSINLARNFVLTGAAGRSGEALAEHVLMFCLMLSSRYPAFARAQAQQQWLTTAPEGARALLGQTMGIIGLGHTGKALAKRAAAFGMTVLGYRRRATPPPEGVTAVFSKDAGDAIDVLLERSDIVVLAVSLSNATVHLIGRREFRLMRKGVLLINIARGHVIDQTALIDALESGYLAGAGLDVTSPEPLPSEHPLWSAPNILITPHMTAPLPDKAERSLLIILDNLRRLRAGEPLLNQVTRDDVYSP